MTAHSSSPPIRAIVTGHTRGIGAAVATQLLERGMAVLGLSRGKHPSLGREYGDRLAEVELDLSDVARVAAWLDSDGLRRFVDGATQVLLFNNAGTVEPIGPLATQDPATAGRAAVLNVATPLMLSSAVARAVPDDAECRIVHISSGAARNPYAGWSVYCATKAALDQHARAVALDANRALRICSVAPGVIDTDMQATLRASSSDRFPAIEKFTQMKASGALTPPDVVARKLIDYVSSDTYGTVPTVDLRDLPAA